MLLVTVAVANAEGNMSAQDNIRLSLETANSSVELEGGVNGSKKKWKSMRNNFLKGGSQLSKSLRRSMSNGKASPAVTTQRRESSGFNLFGGGGVGEQGGQNAQLQQQQQGFMKVFNFFGGGNHGKVRSGEARKDEGVVRGPERLEYPATRFARR